MTKEEKIKEAWAGFYNPQVKENGWMRINSKTYANEVFFDILKINSDTSSIRPKSLRGIEDNNGWIKIESEDDLPNNSGDFWIINAYGSLIEASFLVNIKAFFKFGDIKATHYQPIIKPQPPIY